ncbi:MAG: 16S rRNA (cytosine(1402)-N(4))-methyltransferase RsmH, partial [Patescibacteria group bacterium]
MSTYHTPVLLTETLEAMNLKPGATVVDATLGGGGHAGEIMQRISPAGHLIGLDRDAQALSAARTQLNQAAQAVEGRQVKVNLVQDRFDTLAQHLEALKITQVDAILADLGVSSHQLDASERGFSFQTEAPLDMRMDQSQGETAQELIHRLSEQELTQVLRDYGEESLSRPIARMIKQAEAEGRLNTTTELALLVANVSRRRYRTPSRVHPATRTFQAL